ncbi:S8 family peptidase [Rossellomorea sp. NPDC077527]|uniref:S8 family peptidase n=1 Tax=Rossellomorea sp. NPDC077527 TaxID=3364510 RepID=UPI0037C60B58
MKRYIIMAFMLFIMALQPVSNVSANSISSDQEETVRMTIGFKDRIDLSVLDSYPYEIHHVIDRLKAVSVSLPQSALSDIEKSEGIDWVEKDQEVKVDGQVVDWGHAPVKASEASRSGYTGKGVKVAVIDTGISSSHPDLHVRGGVSFVDGVEALKDDNGHGTHVAGIIAGMDNAIGVLGVSPGVELYSVKALDSGGIGNQTDVVAGIDWAIKHDIDIINLSITTFTDSLALKKIIQQANEKGILVTAASGNEETGAGQPAGTDIAYPARYDEVIGVGAITQEMKRALFSYIGPSLEFTAPGERIYSTYVTNGGATDGYAYMSGTSMATPYVTGVMALYKEAFPDLSSEELRSFVQEHALDLGQKGKDDQYGFGLIQSPYAMSVNNFKDLKGDAWYSESIEYLLDQELIAGYPDGTFRPHEQITREEAATIIGRTFHLDGERRASIFPDVKPDSYSSGFIASGYEQNLITGYPDGTYKPKQSINRGDAALILYRAFAYPFKKNDVFSDVKEENYFYQAVSTLSASGITNGYKDGTYKADRDISRAEFSVMLARALQSAPEN